MNAGSMQMRARWLQASRVSDGKGGWSRDFDDQGEFLCQISEAATRTSRERVEAMQRGVHADWIVDTLADLRASIGDRVEWGERDGPDLVSARIVRRQPPRRVTDPLRLFVLEVQQGDDT